MPFLFAPETRARPRLSVNRVGPVPQSASGVGSDTGSDQEPLTASVVASTATSASPCVWVFPVELSARLPVVTYTVFRAASTTGFVQIVPPTWPSGTTFQVFTIWRVARFTRSSFPCTSGMSQRLATPTYAWPLSAAGLDQL